MQIKIKKLKDSINLPSYGHPGDAGLDMHSLENYDLKPGEGKIFMCGFALEFPAGYVALVKDRGSMAKTGLHTVGGVFDAGFRGEYNVKLVNLTNKTYQIKNGDRIAQLVIMPVVQAELHEVDELSDSSRGLGQFGSTGR